MSRIQVFEREAARYDAWFDSEPGKTLFASELLCLRQLSDNLPRPWLEIGVGTGRFAGALGVDVGVDPASAVLQYAKRRGIPTLRALGYSLPFPAERFGAVFVVVTLCFADSPENLLREAARITRRDGGVVLGIVPAESPLGKSYAAKGRAGHLFYSKARFFTLQEVKNLAEDAGLRFDRAASTLFAAPDERVVKIEYPHPGDDSTAGFIVMLFRPRSQESTSSERAGTKESKGSK